MAGQWKWIKEPFFNAEERYVALQAGDDRDILGLNVNTNFGTWIEVWDDDVAAMIAAAPETAAERDRLREINADLLAALEEIASQKPSGEMHQEDFEMADFQGGYDACVKAARAAIAKAEGSDA